MLFASPTCRFVFLPVCRAAYFACPGMRAKNALLLGASWLFYAWGEPVYILLLLAMSGFNYAAALAIDARHDEAARQRALALAVAVQPARAGGLQCAAFAVSTLDWALRPGVTSQ